mmetsp:Transcript_12133/g.28422  ORF Transcript_12133/g.28422 Transcript_12133/m.28422 type:complete len:915 (-) Transcript_12133:516-3260(-)
MGNASSSSTQVTVADILQEIEIEVKTAADANGELALGEAVRVLDALAVRLVGGEPRSMLEEQLKLMRAEKFTQDTLVGNRCWQRHKASQPSSAKPDPEATDKWGRARNGILRLMLERRKEEQAQRVAELEAEAAKAADEMRSTFVKLRAGKGEGLVDVEFDGLAPLGVAIEKSKMVPQLLMVNGFSRDAEGNPLPAEASEQVKLGSLVVKIADKPVWNMGFMETIVLLQGKLKTAANTGKKFAVTFAPNPNPVLHAAEASEYDLRAAQSLLEEMTGQTKDAQMQKLADALEEVVKREKTIKELQKLATRLGRSEVEYEARLGERCWHRYKDIAPKKLQIHEAEPGEQLDKWVRARNGILKFRHESRKEEAETDAQVHTEADEMCAKDLRNSFIRYQAGKGDTTVSFSGEEPMGLMLSLSVVVPQLVCVSDFKRHPETGKKLAAERSGRVHRNMLLVKVNDSVLWGKGIIASMGILQGKLATARKGGAKCVCHFSNSPKDLMVKAEKVRYEAIRARSLDDHLNPKPLPLPPLGQSDTPRGAAPGSESPSRPTTPAKLNFSEAEMEREISKLREEKKRMMKQVEMAKLDAAAQRKKAAVAEMAVSSGSSSGAAPWLPGGTQPGSPGRHGGRSGAQLSPMRLSPGMRGSSPSLTPPHSLASRTYPGGGGKDLLSLEDLYPEDSNKEPDMRVRDYSVLVDASASMRLKDSTARGTTRWELAREALELIVPQVCAADEDGITLYFFSSGYKKFTHVNTVDQVRWNFQNEKPKGGTMLAEALTDAVIPDNIGRPETVLVITDGAPENRRGVEEVIRAAADGLDNGDDLRVVFVQVGHDFGAKAWLSSLRIRLKLPFDILECVSSDQLARTGVPFAQWVARSILPTFDPTTLPPDDMSFLSAPPPGMNTLKNGKAGNSTDW